MIKHFTDDSDTIKEYRRLEKRIRRELKATVHLFRDEEDGNPENKFLTAELQKAFPDGIIFITSANTVEEIILNIREYLDY